jgi:ABC-type dipeptide/oligopeptide/nickel transport system permease subunit
MDGLVNYDGKMIREARTLLMTVIVAVLISLGLGVPVGLLRGYVGRRLDEMLSRATDILLAFSGIPVAITIIAIYILPQTMPTISAYPGGQRLL